jgi:hypothetical protein
VDIIIITTGLINLQTVGTILKIWRNRSQTQTIRTQLTYLPKVIYFRDILLQTSTMNNPRDQANASLTFLWTFIRRILTKAI